MSVATSGIEASGQGEGLIGNAVLIAGPTASGKSRFALDVARRTGGVIVNADSMQVYSGLSVLTARPDAGQFAAAPHFLYGHVDPRTAYSTGAWLRDVARLHREGAFAGRRPIFVGGTGLYFRGLLAGLSEMPQIPAQIRDRWRRRLLEEGGPKLHQALMQEDPMAAASLSPADGQRIARALEVLEASGRSILHWRSAGAAPLADDTGALKLVIEPDREVLVERIERRFDEMLRLGALEEARAMLGLRLDPGLPATKAIGLRELQAHLKGEIPRAEAVSRAKAATRQYAKRQTTWFRNQLAPTWHRLSSPRQLGDALDAL